MLKSILASLLAFSAFAADEAPKKPSFAEEAYQKAIEANSKDAFKTYDAYQKALDDANKKIVKALEAVKADLNNVKKGSMSLTERADAIKEVDEKIAEIRKGSLGEVVSSRKSGDLLGDGSEVDIKKMIVGKWKVLDMNVTLIFTKDSCQWVESGSSINGKMQIKNDTVSILFSNGSKGLLNIDTKTYTINPDSTPITHQLSRLAD